MNELLKNLHDRFYIPPAATELKQEIEETHQTLIERLSKEDRRLVLLILDDNDQIAENISTDSFISGFRLAWRLATELNHYEKVHPIQMHFLHYLNVEIPNHRLNTCIVVIKD